MSTFSNLVLPRLKREGGYGLDVDNICSKVSAFSVAQVYLYELHTDYGCNGDEHEGYVAASEPKTTDEVSEARRQVRVVTKAARGVLEGSLGGEPRFDHTFRGTRGEFEAALEQWKALRTQVREQVRETEDRVEIETWRKLGFVMLDMDGSHIQVANSEYTDLPLASVSMYSIGVQDRQGCRCSYGGGSTVYYDETDVSESDPECPPEMLVPRPLWLISNDEVAFLTIANGLTDENSVGMWLAETIGHVRDDWQAEIEANHQKITDLRQAQDELQVVQGDAVKQLTSREWTDNETKSRKHKDIEGRIIELERNGVARGLSRALGQFGIEAVLEGYSIKDSFDGRKGKYSSVAAQLVAGT